MSGLVLFDNPVSSNALKVRFALEELGLRYERREIPLTRPRPPEYVALNPLGGVPGLLDGGFFVAESNAILRYLAAREGRDDLHPADPRDRARVDEFLDRFATGLRAAFFRHEREALGYTPEGGFGAAPPRPEAAARVAGEIAPQLAILDGLVTPRGAVLGRFTIACCAVAPVLFRTTVTGLALDGFPNLLGLRERLLARPAFAAAGPVR